jgi:hypothetical protein
MKELVRKKTTIKPQVVNNNNDIESVEEEQ